MHPNYNDTTVTNDIVILKFASLKITSSFKLAFICLPKQNQDPFQTNPNLVAIGWRTTSQYIQAYSSTSNSCQQSGTINSNLQFCAGVTTGGKDTCQGNSGSPLMTCVNNCWVLAGTTSVGIGCAQAGYPGISEQTSTYASFIQSTANISVINNVGQSNSSSNHANVLSNLMTMVSVGFSFLAFIFF
ncbi:unnamed protein product [Rotaria socialis]|uniref:Peptidase S1 domain-containing protein n=1 Tax=Rotaria socialis TaxID=392032 RepID=A0A819AJ84_9BILA|nr:unnamed protein product [Rotaria socialis]